MVNFFIPFQDFKQCAAVLDKKRLWAQIREAIQVSKIAKRIREAKNEEELKAIGYRNHPVTKMWKDYPEASRYYICVMTDELVTRYPDFDTKWILENIAFLGGWIHSEEGIVFPPFLEDARVRESHRSSLWHKDPEHYKDFAQYGKQYSSYVWPVPVKKPTLFALKTPGPRVRRRSNK